MEYLVGFGVMIILIVVNSNLAASKNRSVGLAIISTLFFGIFTTFYYLLVSKSTR